MSRRTDQPPVARDLEQREVEQARERTAVGAHIVHEAIAREGREELERAPSALAWSGLAAGLSMGFSLVAEGLLRAHLPDAPWRPLVSKLGYCVGFLIVVLGRQQLFTENTLTVVLPFLERKDRETFLKMLRLWAVVLAANLTGALCFAGVLTHAALFPADVHAAFLQIGRESGGATFGLTVLRGVFAAWLIALMVWLLPAAEQNRFHVIVVITWLVAIGGFAHIVAGATEVFVVAWSGATTWGSVVLDFLAPTLIGNVAGGVSLVAMLNHKQVNAGQPSR